MTVSRVMAWQLQKTIRRTLTTDECPAICAHKYFYMIFNHLKGGRMESQTLINLMLGYISSKVGSGISGFKSTVLSVSLNTKPSWV